MPTSKGFCTAEDVRAQSPIATGVVSRFDATMDMFITQASQLIRRFCNRQFDKGAYTIYRMCPDTFNMQENYRVRVPEWPVEPGSLFVTYDPNGQFIPNVSSPVELTETVDYFVDNDTGWIDIVSHGLSYCSRGLKIEWNGGYTVEADVTKVPDEVRLACALQVSFIIDRIAKAQMGQQQEKGNRGGNMHVFTQDAQTGLTSEVQVMLHEYRVPLIGRF